MRSFTSNFKQESPVLGLVALALLTCELGLRIFAARLSLDLQHIQEIPQIINTLSNSRHPTLLFLGNSLTRRAVIPDVLTEQLSAHGFSNVHIAKIHPDDTNIADWYYLYERYVRAAGGAPNDLLVGFAEGQLNDSQILHINLLGGSLAGLGAVSEVFHYDVKDFNNRIDYLLASLSCAYANRDRVRTQLFGAIIPYYKTSAQVMNNSVKVQHGSSGNGASWHYQRLTRFLQLTEGGPTHVIFIAIPLPTLLSYPVDPSLQSVLKANGSRLIDLRQIEGLTDSDYLDGYHLSPLGGAIFTRALSQKLLESDEFRRSLRK
jgi:hypothetical protein